MKRIWNNPSEVMNINQTDICLIPKVDQPQVVNQFRLISLYNVIYKVVSKVVVSILKACMPKLVSPYQTGFIPGRSICENIIVSKEVFHTMHNMKS